MANTATTSSDSSPKTVIDKPIDAAVVTSTSVAPKKKEDSPNEALEWAKAMGDYVPLLQTLAWVFLALWLLRKFKTELTAIVVAIKKRIEAGGSVKAGPIEFGEMIRPQSSAEQVARIKEETVESEGMINSEGDEDESSSSSSDSSGADHFRSRYVLAEDLALRKIQEEFGEPLMRQVAIGDRSEFDGFFVQANHPYGIEVKYVRNNIRTTQFASVIDSIHGRIRALGWRKFTLIFVLVTDDEEQPPEYQVKQLRERLNNLGGKTILRIFRFKELADEFGIDLWESE